VAASGGEGGIRTLRRY